MSILNKFLSYFKKVEETDKGSWVIEYYKSPKNNKWYFRTKSNNGKIVNSSRQAYSNKKDMLETIEQTQLNLPMAQVVDVTNN